MRTRVITVSFLLIVLSVILANQSVTDAQSPQNEIRTCDYGDTAVLNPAGTNIFAYKVVQSWETEKGGGWISGETYQCNWTIKLDYVNQDFINGTSYIMFYLPTPLGTNLDYIPLNPNVATQAINNQTQLSNTQKAGTLTAIFTPENTTSFTFGLGLQFAVYINGVNSTDDLKTGACQSPFFSTEVYSSTEALEVAQAPEFPSAIAILMLLAATSVGLLMVKRRRATSFSTPRTS